MDFGIHELKVKPLSISLLKLTTLILLLIIVTLFQFSNASIHTYDRQSFNEVGNALLLSGGSEGILASRASLTSSSSKHIVLHSLHDGISFIRYFVFFNVIFGVFFCIFFYFDLWIPILFMLLIWFV